MSFIMSLSAEQGFALYEKAAKEEVKTLAWEQWLVDYGRMTKDNFKTFSQYYKELTRPKTIDNRTEEEVIDDAENILRSMKRSD